MHEHHRLLHPHHLNLLAPLTVAQVARHHQSHYNLLHSTIYTLKEKIPELAGSLLNVLYHNYGTVIIVTLCCVHKIKLLLHQHFRGSPTT